MLADNTVLTGSGDVMVTVATEGAAVDMDGMTREVSVVVLEDDVTITNAPEGTEVTVAADVNGTTVNGTAVTAGQDYTVPGQTTTGGGGGGGGAAPSRLAPPLSRATPMSSSRTIRGTTKRKNTRA